MAKYEDKLRGTAQVGLAISDPGRLRLLMALSTGRSLCVCQLTELLALAPSTVSKHLSVLKQAGLVTETKKGRWVYHEICDDQCPCHPIAKWVQGELGRDEQIAQDKTRLKQILELTPEELCCK